MVLKKMVSQPDSYDGSPSRFSLDSLVGISSFGSSPTSTLYQSTCSPPMSPVSSIGQNSVNELASSVRNMQLGNGTRLSANSVSGAGFCSHRNLSTLRPGYTSLPSTPTRKPTRSGGSIFDQWDHGFTREEPVMERVESGKEIRAKMYAKLSRENSLAGRVDSAQHDEWVSELVE
ncbi:hypothetical protein E3N88_32815 [Mikania micrantha]|uniref:Uncharacterized protein n=1 Tax=Mikania micrantha TaxID=192012 RepID=A0A5N6M9G0_9ASTR|nr:hypothetical protein E3N88_32815 [Mikania micrantha]